MQKIIILKIQSFLILFYLFLVLVGCEDSTKPADESPNLFNKNFLFVEYRIYTYGELEKDSASFALGRYNSCYYYDDLNSTILVDTLFQNKIDTTNKFIIGSVVVLGPNIGYGIVGTLKGFGSFNLTDSVYNPPFTYGHQIRMINCDLEGETRISFDNKEFSLKPKEIFLDTLFRTHVALPVKNNIFYYSYINDIIIVRNFGFINKKNIKYYNSNFD
jgi:hypothetical protein